MGKINNTYIRHADSYALAGVTLGIGVVGMDQVEDILSYGFILFRFKAAGIGRHPVRRTVQQGQQRHQQGISFHRIHV
ncbi:hypothetical protein [Megasphaera stantonii]|uniref:hypothetical protein n=1 Tax=Megasphaera stantonii TaxID=2144175 RepID=UPI00262E8104|nr:hypothetical protein [Megasphaera stantonii]